MSIVRYDSAKIGSPALHELRELLRYRYLLSMLVSNSIKTRYKRSSLGVVWTLLNPLLNTLVLTLAFSQIFRFDLDNYPIYLLTGLVFWNFFAQTTSNAMNQMIWGTKLIGRIYVPRTIFTISVVGNGLVNLLLTMIPLALVMLFMGHPFRLALVMVPVAVIFTTMFVMGITLLISTLAVFFVDVVDLYNVLLSAFFYLTPIIYPASIIPERWRFLIEINPLYILLEILRRPVYDGLFPWGSQLLLAGGIAGAVLLAGWLVFTYSMDQFAYRI